MVPSKALYNGCVKRKALRLIGKSDTAALEQEIQCLVREIVIARDGRLHLPGHPWRLGLQWLSLKTANSPCRTARRAGSDRVSRGSRANLIPRSATD